MLWATSRKDSGVVALILLSLARAFFIFAFLPSPQEPRNFFYSSHTELVHIKQCDESEIKLNA